MLEDVIRYFIIFWLKRFVDLLYKLAALKNSSEYNSLLLIASQFLASFEARSLLLNAGNHGWGRWKVLKRARWIIAVSRLNTCLDNFACYSPTLNTSTLLEYLPTRRPWRAALRAVTLFRPDIYLLIRIVLLPLTACKRWLETDNVRENASVCTRSIVAFSLTYCQSLP